MNTYREIILETTILALTIIIHLIVVWVWKPVLEPFMTRWTRWTVLGALALLAAAASLAAIVIMS